MNKWYSLLETVTFIRKVNPYDKVLLLNGSRRYFRNIMFGSNDRWGNIHQFPLPRNLPDQLDHFWLRVVSEDTLVPLLPSQETYLELSHTEIDSIIFPTCPKALDTVIIQIYIPNGLLFKVINVLREYMKSGKTRTNVPYVLSIFM